MLITSYWLLPAGHLQFLRGDVGRKDGNAARLGVDLGEALNDQDILWVTDGLGDGLPLLGGNIHDVVSGDCRGGGQAFGQGRNPAGLHDGHHAAPFVHHFAGSANQGDLHGGASFLGSNLLQDDQAVFPGEG